MNRLNACFAHRVKVLVPFITCGFPQVDMTVDLMHLLVAGGADIIELGVPFSDPMADGIVIQQANAVALAQGVGVWDVLRVVQAFRVSNKTTPVVLMSYANPLEKLGLAAFLEAARDVQVDGLIVVDYPLYEQQKLSALCIENQIAQILMLAPDSTAERIQRIVQVIKHGYLYCVSLNGVTGSGALNTQAVCAQLRRVRAQTDLPVTVGFGISDPKVAAQVAQYADGVVVGSKVIRLIEQALQDGVCVEQRLVRWLLQLRAALDAVEGDVSELA